VWPTEDFEAALSYVPVEPIEDDLFAGIPDAAAGDALATKGSLDLVYDGRREPQS
jgi:mycothiol S-conjugate amidase